jgi:hypothetical protein
MNDNMMWAAKDGRPVSMAMVGVVLIALLVIAAVAMIRSRRWRRLAPRVLAVVLGSALAAYAVARGIAEFWLVDFDNPASYQNDWGGPSLFGVFLVHSGPGLAVIIGGLVWLLRRRRGKQTERVDETPAQRVP